jgi:hypothetical protein
MAKKNFTETQTGGQGVTPQEGSNVDVKSTDTSDINIKP